MYVSNIFKSRPILVTEQAKQGFHLRCADFISTYIEGPSPENKNAGYFQDGYTNTQQQMIAEIMDPATNHLPLSTR